MAENHGFSAIVKCYRIISSVCKNYNTRFLRPKLSDADKRTEKLIFWLAWEEKSKL